MILSLGDYETQLKYWTTTLLPDFIVCLLRCPRNENKSPLPNQSFLNCWFPSPCSASAVSLQPGPLIEWITHPLIPLHNPLSLHRRYFPVHNACEVSSRGARISRWRIRPL
ncbi:hypothetical protein CEXT_168351 [Caerostris extrusa]|uniref:Uncharacterized protein n=1 Tax=Caerostris extrusa TaxID=172846 RepID=A0AAV4Y5I1_CAEEX|nr:hypothetical protein CEXT_168351 [Caerostris extrusa]